MRPPEWAGSWLLGEVGNSRTIVRAGGYTLIELLVVVAIVAALVSVASLAWRTDPARMLEAEARRLAGKLELAQARARMGGRLAFSASADDYLFWQRDATGLWRELDAAAGLERRTLAPGIRVSELRYAGIAIAPGQRVAIAADDEVALAITLAGPGASAVIANGAYAGQMSVRLARGEP